MDKSKYSGKNMKDFEDFSGKVLGKSINIDEITVKYSSVKALNQEIAGSIEAAIRA